MRKMKNMILLGAMILASAPMLPAQEELKEQPWLHIYMKDGKDFVSVPMEEAGAISFNANVVTGSATRMAAAGHDYDMTLISRWTIGPTVPRLYITTDYFVNEIPDKINYLDADLVLEGMGVTPDVTDRVKIRGRGNSTWVYPKKPYRLKFAAKTSIYGYKKAKNYCLLANYLDETMMKNVAASAALQLLGVDGAFHVAPLELYLNDTYMGSYMLTEKMGINNGCLDMSKEDEARSALFELDSYFDDENQFISPNYHLPVILKDPDLPEDPQAAQEWTDKWTADFNMMEQAVADGENIGEWIDYESLARYLVAFNICCNQEINHPKSVFLHKTEGGKYIFGPGWDFDWAFGFEPTYAAVSTSDDAKKLHDEAVEYLIKAGIGENLWSQLPNGTWVLWRGGEVYFVDKGQFVVYPGSMQVMGPSYEAPLLGTGSNGNHSNGTGYGGEFFLDIIGNNAEFMDVYSQVWEDFYNNHLDEFWKIFNDYERVLRPSAANNGTKWGYGMDQENQVANLRNWIKNRIEYINNSKVNYGLFNK